MTLKILLPSDIYHFMTNTAHYAVKNSINPLCRIIKNILYANNTNNSYFTTVIFCNYIKSIRLTPLFRILCL